MAMVMDDLHCAVHCGDAISVLREMPDESVNCIVTSPPYFGLRDYGHEGQIGLEPTPQEFIMRLVEVFRECRRVLRADGTCWVNVGDSYAGRGKTGGMSSLQRSQSALDTKGWVPQAPGFKDKDLYGIPWRLAFALQDDGWWLRQDIIWAKPNPMPESVRDRCTKSHEYLFLLAKSKRYWSDMKAIAEPAESAVPDWHGPNSGMVVKHVPGNSQPSRKVPSGWQQSEHYAGQTVGYVGRSGNKERKPATERGCLEDRVAGSVPWEGTTRNTRSVWTIATQPYKEAHFATFPEELARRCILAGCPVGGIVLDPFAGSGTTLAVAVAHERRAIGIEINPDYITLINKRMSVITPSLFGGAHG